MRRSPGNRMLKKNCAIIFIVCLFSYDHAIANWIDIEDAEPIEAIVSECLKAKTTKSDVNG